MLSQDSIWRSKAWWALLITLTSAFTVGLILFISSSDDQQKEINSFKLMNCQDQKKFLLKNINEGKVGIYPYSIEQSYYELECLSK